MSFLKMPGQIYHFEVLHIVHFLKGKVCALFPSQRIALSFVLLQVYVGTCLKSVHVRSRRILCSYMSYLKMHFASFVWVAVTDIFFGGFYTRQTSLTTLVFSWDGTAEEAVIVSSKRSTATFDVSRNELTYLSIILAFKNLLSELIQLNYQF